VRWCKQHRSKEKSSGQKDPLPPNTLNTLNTPKNAKQELMMTNKDPSNRVSLQKEIIPNKHPPPHLNNTSNPFNRITTTTTASPPLPLLLRRQTTSPRNRKQHSHRSRGRRNQQQNTGSDADLKRKHNPNRKKASTGDKEKVHVVVEVRKTKTKHPKTPPLLLCATTPNTLKHHKYTP
jgi:hypothetical protein